MENIRFEDDKYTSHRILGEKETPAIVQFLLKTKIVKTKKQAYYTYLIFVVILFAIAFYFLYSTYWSNPEQQAIPYEQMTQAQKNQIPFQERMYIESRLNNLNN